MVELASAGLIPNEKLKTPVENVAKAQPDDDIFDAADELLPQVQKCLAEPGVHLIDVPVDYSLNDKTLNQTLRNRSAAI